MKRSEIVAGQRICIHRQMFLGDRPRPNGGRPAQLTGVLTGQTRTKDSKVCEAEVLLDGRSRPEWRHLSILKPQPTQQNKNMQLNELIECQRKLQTVTDIEIPDSQNQRFLALAAEVGELAQALKPSWRWWGHRGKAGAECDRAELLAECADVLHFLLVEAIAQNFTTHGRDLWDIAWVTPPHKLNQGWGLWLGEMLSSVLMPNGLSQAFFRYVFAMRELGFSQSEIEDSYKAKAEFNTEMMEANNA